MTNGGDYGMYTAAGARRVHTLVTRVRKADKSNATKVAMLRAGVKSIAVKYSEVGDTAVRESIAWALDPKGQWLSISAF